MNKIAFAIPLAYPDTVVMVSDEWYVKHLHYIGIGKKNYVKAGHAALVLIEKETGLIEYFDFGRYITPQSYGRVRSAVTDHELSIDFKAEIVNGELVNRDAIFNFFATNPKLTHGEGRLVATVCDNVNYDKAKSYIFELQEQYLVKYAAFKRDASNCARFVTDTLIRSISDPAVLKKLNGTKLFTPSPIGNVLAVKGENEAFQVSTKGVVAKFTNSKQKEIVYCFLDRINSHKSSLKGTLEPSKVKGLSAKAQWLSGIGSGAWFELFKTDTENEFLFKRTSAYGTVDTYSRFVINKSLFNINESYKFDYSSNCNQLKIIQNDELFTFYRHVNLKLVAHKV
jgi:hypothetical protein